MVTRRRPRRLMSRRVATLERTIWSVVGSRLLSSFQKHQLLILWSYLADVVGSYRKCKLRGIDVS